MPPVKLDLISTNAPKALKVKRFSLVNIRGEDNIALCLGLDREIGGVSPPLGGIRNSRGRSAARVTLKAHVSCWFWVARPPRQSLDSELAARPLRVMIRCAVSTAAN